MLLFIKIVNSNENMFHIGYLVDFITHNIDFQFTCFTNSDENEDVNEPRAGKYMLQSYL